MDISSLTRWRLFISASSESKSVMRAGPNPFEYVVLLVGPFTCIVQVFCGLMNSCRVVNQLRGSKSSLSTIARDAPSTLDRAAVFNRLTP